MNCIHCKKILARDYFRISRMTLAGATLGHVDACSLICMVSWTYNFGVKKGAQGVVAVKETIMQISQALLGGDKTGGKKTGKSK